MQNAPYERRMEKISPSPVEDGIPSSRTTLIASILAPFALDPGWTNFANRTLLVRYWWWASRKN